MNTGNSKSSRTGSPKRWGKTTQLGDLVGKLIDPALKKRGFASQDILENWRIIAPPPYNKVTIPDNLKWRRGQAGGQGALLFLRCAEAHRVGLAHDHQRIAAAINRYFGYILVDAVKLSVEPFTPGSGHLRKTAPEPSKRTAKKVETALGNIEDDGLKNALRKLGLGVLNDQNH